jgi:hypothetical protein
MSLIYPLRPKGNGEFRCNMTIPAFDREAKGAGLRVTIAVASTTNLSAPGFLPSDTAHKVMEYGGAACLLAGSVLFVRNPRVRMIAQAPRQAMVFATEFRRPWLVQVADAAHRKTLTVQKRLFEGHHVDDSVDAWRHAYGSGLMKLRLMRDRDLSEVEAGALTIRLGEAHEADGFENGSALAAEMDLENNRRGVDLLGNGRTLDGTWITERAWRNKVLASMENGDLLRIDGDPPVLVPTTADPSRR